MKKLVLFLALMLCFGVDAIAETKSPVMRKGDLISHHLTALKAYGNEKPLLATPSGIPGDTEVMMWRIGDDILTVTISIGAGIIKDMSYIVRTDGGKGMPLKVKSFNPITGEVTIMIPTKPNGGVGKKP